MSEAEQVILNHLSEQLKRTQNEALERLEGKLSDAILRLESDDVLDRMSNDPTLEEFKLTRVRELLQDVFAGERQLAVQSRALAELKNNLFLLEVDRNKEIQMGKRKEQDYMDSLADIEQKYGRYREQVEQQAINDHRAIEELERECDQKDRKIEQLEQKLSSSESATQQIRSDMAIVRDKWQQRCREVEDEWKLKHNGDIEQLKKHYHAKLESMVAEYNKCSKQGAPMVVQADEEMISGLKKDMRELRSRCAQAELLVEEQSREMEMLHRENTQYKESIHEQRERESRITSENKSVNDRYQDQQRSLEEKTEDCRRLAKQISSLKKEIQQLRGELQKQERLRKELEEEQLKELEDIRDRIERESEDSRLKQSSELHSAKEQLRQRSNELDQLELEIASLQKTESRLKQELNTKDHTIIEQQTRLSADKLKFRALKENQRKLVRAIEQIRLPMQRLKNQNNLLKEQVKYELEVYKRRLQTELIGIIDRVVSLKEKVEKDSTQKMVILLAQVEESSRRESAQLQRAQAENDILQARLNEYERAFEEKLVEIKEDVRAKDTATTRMTEQLQKAKDTIERLQMENDQHTRDWERELKQFKKEIVKTIHNRKQTSSQNLYDMIAEELRIREKEVEKAKLQNRQKDDLLDELEKKLQQARNREDDLKDRFSDLESLRDRCHMEQQARRKLEKELKDLRLQLLTKEGTINELTKLRREKQNISRNHKDEKERELEQIRAMIVKTYEVVGGRPSHDIPERGKRTAK